MDLYDEKRFNVMGLLDRENKIKQTFLTSYIDEIAGNITILVVKECYGCEVDHPSQRRHECLMMPGEDRMLFYFDKARENIESKNVMEDFVEALKEKGIELNAFEKEEYSFNNCFNFLCSSPDQKEMIKQQTHKIVCDRSFY